MPSRTGDDWGDEAEAPHALALPSGRTVAPIGNVVAGGDQNGPALANGFTIKPRFFDEGGTGQRLAGILGPALMTLGGNPQGAQQMIQLQHRQRELKQERARQGQQDQFERDKFAWQRRKDMRPEIRSAGRSVVSVPFEGDPLVLYSDPSEADRYASALGLQPGDDGYDEAVQDYVLKGYGPTAMGGKKTFEDIRYDNRKGLRGLPTYRDLHPRPTGGGGGGGRRAYDPNRPPRTTGEAVAPIVAKMARGEALTQGERAALATYGRRGGARLPDMTPAPNAPAPRGEPVRVNTPAQARALPKGTVFVTPDGKQKVR
jgi:hypothetical protein